MPPTVTEQFAALWESGGSPPDVFAFLEQYGDADSSQKLAVIRLDQQ